MIKTDKNYIQGTAARKLEYDVYEENKVLNEKKKRRVNNKVKVKVAFAFLMVFSLCGLIMYRYALITDINYQINAKMNEYTEIKNDNTRLVVKIESELDLPKVKQIAEENLGMHLPDKHQYTYISIPKSDFTDASGEIKDEGKNDANFFDTLVSKVDELTRFLY